ncbi:BppU family phage baseplate upper protein [Limosilactobacillus sp.]|jgi:hypothetical protein|uniref:BppU family phage baseplate upper protein n=1 Tax=Limosilactobacillus sp. TaxID=2773925 RepID=UPI0025C50187|nr:BppU family phage baseplate upper protein [Limosilactobacillus sp.]MCH3922392.1 phage baseplate upper protein [Limosilactobacillus sp.]MCH3929164.1 phage baseplate upper protein [Limosilactobacillus sp.]
MAIRDYLVIDIAKPVQTFANLSDYFRGRVGDAEAYCKLWIKFGTRPIDMTNKKLRFEGDDPNNTPFVDAGRFDAGDDGDIQMGMITFYFPKGIFQVEGKWQHAFFKLQDQKGSDISSVDLDLQVLPNNVEMGINIHAFDGDLEALKKKINQAIREMNAQQLLNQIESMKTTVGAYTDLIARNQILNKPDTIKLINDQIAQESAKLDSKMSSLSNQLNGSMSDLRKSVDAAGWHYKGLHPTLINGATGWITMDLTYNDTVYIVRYFGWIKVPGNTFFINFTTNPLTQYLDLTNHTIYGTMMMAGDGDAATKGYGRVIAGVQPDPSQGQALGLWSSVAAPLNGINNSSTYQGLLNLMIMGPRWELHNV